MLGMRVSDGAFKNACEGVIFPNKIVLILLK